MTAYNPPHPELHTHLAESVRVLQIIVAALVGSCVAIATLAMAVLPGRDGDAGPQGPQALTYVALGGAAAAFAVAAVVSRAIVTSGRRRLASGEGAPPRPDRRIPWQHAEFQARFGDHARLAGIYVTKTIVAAAILEGAAYLGLGAFYVTRNPLALAATCAALAGIAVGFPTLSRTQRWIEDQRRRVEEERSLSRHAVSF